MRSELRIEYNKLEIPDIVLEKHFWDFTKKETEAYFQWFMSIKDERIEVLKNYIEEEGNENIKFDYTPESLIPLWDWYVEHIVMVKKTEEEIEQERSQYPDYVTIDEEKISYDTLQIGYDISCYFGEVIIRNSEGKAYWGYKTKPKNMMSVKKPVLLGFAGDDFLDAAALIPAITWRYIEAVRENREESARGLFDLYDLWHKMLYKTFFELSL